MFCNGECETIKDNKQLKCGLLFEVIMENKLEGKVETVKGCVFHHIMNSLARQEQGQIRIQASVESGRNQKANDDNKMSTIVGIGMTGMMHALADDKEKFENALKLLASANEQLKLETEK